jgi:hypothetical protein
MKRLAVTLFLLALHLCHAQTLTLGTSKYAAHRLGMNFSQSDYYSSYNVKNLTFINPGFEGFIAAITHIVVARPAPTKTTFTGNNTYDQSSPNWWAGGTYRVAYSSVPGLTGATGRITANTGSNNGKGSGLGPPTFAISPTRSALAAGDVVWVYKSGAITDCRFGYLGWDCSATGTGSARVDTSSADQFPGTAGKQNIKLTLGSPDDTAKVATGFDTATGTGPGQGPNYFFNGAYTWSIKTKLASGSGITLTLAGSRQGRGCRFSQTIRPTSTPKTQSVSFTCSESSSAVPSGLMALSITASGGVGTVFIDDSSLTSNSDTNPSVFRDNTKANMVSLMNVGSMRLWVGQNASTFANETAPQFGRQIPFDSNGATPWPPTYGASKGILEGLYDFAEAAVLWGVPRISYVVPLTDVWEIRDYVDFLAAPCSSGTAGATARCNQGQKTPFTSVLTDIELSVGNEVWNYAAQGQYIPFGPGAYPQWYYSNIANSVCASAKADSHWNSVLKCNATAQVGNESWGSFDSSVDKFEQNAYYADITINDPTNQWIAELTEAWAFANDCKSGGPSYCQSYAYHPTVIYEGQNGTGSTTGTQSSLDGLANGMGNGLVWTLGMAWAQKRFQMPQYNFFTQYQNHISISHGLTNYIWGAFTGPGGIWNNPRPTAQAIGVLNNCIGAAETGYDVVPAGIPTYNYSGTVAPKWSGVNGIPSETNVPTVQAFLYGPTSGSRCLAIWNVDSSSHTLKLAGRDTPRGTCSTTTFTSKNLHDNNEMSLLVKPSTSSAACSTSITVPKYSLVTTTWSIGSGPVRTRDGGASKPPATPQ